jgi:hypothetical protein
MTKEITLRVILRAYPVKSSGSGVEISKRVKGKGYKV